MAMNQTEIDEISIAFEEAWKDYFGEDIYYLQYKDLVISSDSSLYEERLSIDDQFVTIGPIPGIYNHAPSKEVLSEAGLRAYDSGMITIVTKSLRDLNILEPSGKDRIKVTNRNGETKYFEIQDWKLTTQFVNNFIFTVFGVKEIEG